MYSTRLIGPNEHILIATYPHAMLVAGTILRHALWFIAALLLALFLPPHLPALPADAPPLAVTAWGWLPAVFAWIAVLAAVLLIFNTIGSYIKWRGREYVITDQRLLRTEGLIRKHSISVPLERINNLLVDQSIGGRIWNYGTITVLSGNDVASDVLRYVPHVLEFQRAAFSAQSMTMQQGYPGQPPTQPYRVINPNDPYSGFGR